MAPLTNIANRLTPSTPLEQTFGAQPTASGVKIATLIGHRAAAGGTGTNYVAYQITNVGDPAKAKTEVDVIAGAGSEIGKMAEAFVKANSAVPGRVNFRAFRIIMLALLDADFGAADAALTATKNLRTDMIVSPYDALNGTASLHTKVTDLAAFMSGADRDLNGQFGTTGIFGSIGSLANIVLANYDNQYAVINWLQDLNVAPGQSAAIVAAGSAGAMFQSIFPYKPLERQIIGGLLPPTNFADRIAIGAAEASEQALVAGISPLIVDSAGRVRFLRTRVTRVTVDGSAPATAYLDWQDFQVLYDFREDVFNALQSPALKPAKASLVTAGLVKDEVLRLAAAYETAEAFQFVKELAKDFKVVPSTTSRGRFDFKIPVDVIPGLFVIAGNIEATVFTLP